MKKAFLFPLLIILLLLAVHFLIPSQPKGAAAYVSVDTNLYHSPADPQPFAIIPSGTRVRWISTTPDYAFGYIEATVKGKSVRAYAPWLALNITNDGHEAEQAMAYLLSETGWTAEEAEAYGMHTPAVYMRNQFVSVAVRSSISPQWTYYVWLDKLNGGLHDIQSPFVGEKQTISEKTLRETLRSGTLTDAHAVRSYFSDCFGPEESWSAALKEWADAACDGLP